MFQSRMQFSPHSTRLRLGAGAALLSAAAWANAAPPYPKLIQKAADSGVKVVRSFPAASGLTGWVMSESGHYSTVFTTADKKTLLVGELIGENGENLSALYNDKYVPKPDMAALFEELGKSAYVPEGTLKNPKSVIYVFIDANCPYCHFLWKALQPYQRAGLQVRSILVATLGPTSMPKAIDVMRQTDRTAALGALHENFGKQRTPSKQSDAAGNPAIAASIDQNGALMGKLNIAGTPGVVWKDQQGQVHVKGGMPRLSELAGITGLPEQKIDDPELAKFR